jgi:hypothetical protein
MAAGISGEKAERVLRLCNVKDMEEVRALCRGDVVQYPYDSGEDLLHQAGAAAKAGYFYII